MIAVVKKAAATSDDGLRWSKPAEHFDLISVPSAGADLHLCGGRIAIEREYILVPVANDDAAAR